MPGSLTADRTGQIGNTSSAAEGGAGRAAFLCSDKSARAGWGLPGRQAGRRQKSNVQRQGGDHRPLATMAGIHWPGSGRSRPEERDHRVGGARPAVDGSVGETEL